MEIAENIKSLMSQIFELLNIPLGDLPFTLFDVLLWVMLASVLAYFYRKVMGDD